MFRRSFARLASPLAVSMLLIAVVTVAAGPQESTHIPPPAPAKTRRAPTVYPPGSTRVVDSRAKAKVEIDKMIASYDLEPHPLPAIPDDRPPHEGAMIGLPYIAQPPDLLVVEVLETLPGRPISGERLIQPDGRIDLGFYGTLPVRGLTPDQIKVALIKHLRKYIDDEILGLLSTPLLDAEAEPSPANGPFDLPAPKAVVPSGNPFDEPNVPTKIQKGRLVPGPAPVEPRPPEDVREQAQGGWTIVPLESNDRVLVYPSQYNSTNYYVLGDVLVPGRMPWTGNETVLDALQHASGLLPTAEPKDIRLVRPGRGGKPTKVYKVDLAAIQDQGDARLNYQLFPGDRLIVGRNEVVKKTVEIDRLSEAIQAVTTSIQQNANLLKSLGVVGAGPEGDEALKRLVDFWAKEISRTGDLKFDEQKLRELLLRNLKPGAPPAAPPARPK